MQRIRNWKDLKLYPPKPDSTYEHSNDLFSDDEQYSKWPNIARILYP